MTRYAFLTLTALVVAACGADPDADERAARVPTTGLVVQAETLTVHVPVEGSVLARRRASRRFTSTGSSSRMRSSFASSLPSVE